MKEKLRAFLEGVGSILMIAPPFPRVEAAERTDSDALRSDWESVGNDMRVAIDKYEQENAEKAKP